MFVFLVGGASFWGVELRLLFFFGGCFGRLLGIYFRIRFFWWGQWANGLGAEGGGTVRCSFGLMFPCFRLGISVWSPLIEVVVLKYFFKLTDSLVCCPQKSQRIQKHPSTPRCSGGERGSHPGVAQGYAPLAAAIHLTPTDLLVERAAAGAEVQ